MIIGSGPIIIGQACEFDYSGTQACKALRDLGYDIILVNSNPATIMTDPGMADITYIEPLTIETMIKIIEKEKPDAILPNLGGQTGLNLTSELARNGTLAAHGVKIIGVLADAIERGEDRIAFKETISRILLLSIYFIFIVLTTSSCTDDNVQKQMEPFREMEPLLEDAINEPLATFESLAATPIFNFDPLLTPENQSNPTTPGSEVDFSEAKIIDIVETIPSQFEVVEISKIPARNCSGPTPCFLATAMYMASNTVAGALMVIDVDTLSSGMPSKSLSMSSSEDMATPTLPTSPAASGSSES